ncbi:right-handed parallel beta-helix repeat-containing protein [Spirosoma soli]|uniref:Right-handed parallel beta-helix repeat-containing protein n=1 Tax=Spirosoma soli TaxID=1770529 RepID=A0ABW5M9M1_9BACT
MNSIFSFLPDPTTPRTAKRVATVTNRLVVLLFSLAFLTTSCKKETEVTPNNTLTAAAGADQAVQVGQVVTLDGSASTDSQSKPFTFQWVMTRKPAKSTVALTNATAAKPAFTPDEVGEYEFELTVSNANGRSTDKVLITASVAEPLAITQNITVKTVLNDRVTNPNLPDYIVTKSIALTSELTINPGVVIAFERDTRFDINSDAVIVAKGEADKKIRFVGVQKTKGYWVGIMVYSGSNANVFENIELLHAGSRVLLSGVKAGMGMFGGGKAQLAIRNSQFSENDGYGLFVQDGAILREFATNSFKNNTDAGILLDAVNVVKLDATSAFTGGNGRNVVEVSSSALKEGKEDEIIWPGFADKTPYRLNGDLSVDTGWKLNPGVTVEVSRDAAIRINGAGYLSAKGTPTEKITITGAARTAGYWRGLICYSTSTQNVIENAEVSYAGSNALVSGKKTNIAVHGAKAAMSIKNTKISGSAGHGIYVAYNCILNADAATANTFEANGAANIMIDK